LLLVAPVKGALAGDIIPQPVIILVGCQVCTDAQSASFYLDFCCRLADQVVIPPGIVVPSPVRSDQDIVLDISKITDGDDADFA
jgi:hypothetical protein